MRVNTAELKNNLSRYLRRVRQTGETITVCERNRPVAKLSPLRSEKLSPAREEQKEREALLRRAQKFDITLRLPKTCRPMREIDVEPEVAPDGHTDRATNEWVRGGRDY